MPNKITFAISTLASAASAFGLGALVFMSPDTPEVAIPSTKPPSTAVPDIATDAKPAAGTAAPSSTGTPQTAPTDGKHAKPTTEPETTTQDAPKGKHAKPVEPGSQGLFTDAENDGKLLDDISKTFVPTLPEVPDAWLPFPDGEGTPGNESPDANWGDPGLVCDPELAERLGVELSPTCSRDNNGPADTWGPEETWNVPEETPDAPSTPEETWDVPGGTWGPFATL
ncbi:hypothetical protein HXS80_16010 [Streptomyces sp. CB04723]|uniref:hypothetical protein n=1 Tax=Streptomyces TaxID=1883 RepID=UPI0015C41DB0|nr:hypothetical protein [Streptomyces sp. CB04723]QLG33032.1 hypothetical protein HXS80_16010 [Streptomyces sp. CB04723]